MATPGFNPGLAPGANSGGTNMAVPSPGGMNTPSIGGTSNAFLPQFPGGQSTPPMTSPMSMTPQSGVTSAFGFGGVGGSWSPNQNDFVKAMHKAGFSAGDAALMYNFIASGAGFNQEAINAIFAGMQPQIQRGEADILEHFGGLGMRGSSAAATGLGDFLSQVNLNMGQIEASMYEQAVQNYMQVLMAGKGNPPQNMFQNIMQWMSVMNDSAKAAASLGVKV